MRRGEIDTTAGYDGEFGVIRVFTNVDEIDQLQRTLDDLKADDNRTGEKPDKRRRRDGGKS